MKRILSLALSAGIVASMAASCSAKPVQIYSPKITVSSSEADTYAKWLTDRLGDKLTDEVYLSVGSTEDIDMSDFENDGYVLRAEDGRAFIAGKTTSGLDLAVRKYANSAEKNESDGLDVTYHEGYRIEKFTIAGNDISEYVIEYPKENNDNMLFAVSEFQMLVKKACGAELASSEGITDRKCAIEFRFTEDESLGGSGYKYYVEGARLVIEGARERGCVFGVYRFLEKECGWQRLVFGNSVLLENDHLDIPADLADSETPLFEYFTNMIKSYGIVDGGLHYVEYTDKGIFSREMSYGPVRASNHGMQTKKWGGVTSAEWVQICYSDEELRDNIIDDIEIYISKCLASGQVIGRDLKSIDIAQGDNANYCRCNNCLKIAKEENNALSGAVVRWANAIEESISETYDGLKYLIYAYHGTQIPCKTAPNENVYVTFCTDGNCSNHLSDGSGCTQHFGVFAVNENPVFNNVDFDEWLRGWCELSDHIYVWDYDLGNFQPFIIIDQLYDDYQHWKELGVQGMYWQHHIRFGIESVELALATALSWDNDMTREEFNALATRYIELDYGEDAAGLIEEYIDMRLEAQRTTGCWNCWGYSSVLTEALDSDYFIENADKIEEIIERAIELAGSAKQQRYCETLSVGIYYGICYSAYFKAYDEGDAARIAELSEKYDLLISRLKKYGFDISSIVTIFQARVSISDNLEDEAWTNWLEQRDSLPKGETQRPIPDKYVTGE